MSENEISKHIINAFFEVHKTLGPGLLESIYEHCLMFELKKSGLHVMHQHPLPVVYKGERLDLGYRLDIWVEQKVVIEVKSVESLTNVHFAQILTYLKLTDNKLGFLVNFNVILIKDGFKRVANGMS